MHMLKDRHDTYMQPLHGRAPRKPPDRKGEVSMKKRTSAVEHSPVPKAVLMLLKPAPVSFIQVSHVSPSFQATPMLHIPTVVSPSRIANLETHHIVEACKGAFLIPSSSEVEKERRGPETVSKIKGWKMETLPPVNNTAFIMPVAAPV